jgi:rubrerythrin
MKYGYTADEVFEIAEDIEREGAAFYRQAAQLTSHEQCRAKFLALAEAEEKHIERFRDIRAQVVDRDDDGLAEHPEDPARLFLRIVARGAVYEPAEQVAARLADCRDEKDTLRLAINKELDAILYFSEMKNLIQTESALEAVESIIAEEREHVIGLAEHLRDESPS